MIYLVIYFVLFAVWITAELLLAPKGYEDSQGFHYGRPKKNSLKPGNNKKNLKIFTDKKGKISLQS